MVKVKEVYQVAIAIMLIMAEVPEVIAASSSQTGLMLDVRYENVQGTTTTEFAVNEPVWMSIVLRNTNSVPITVWLNCMEDRGVTCQPTCGDEAKVRVLPSDISDEQTLKKMIVAPGNEITVDVLIMNDYLRVLNKCSLSLDCAIEIQDERGQSVVIKAVAPLQFTSELDTQGISRLVDQLRQQYNSGDEHTRVRMVRTTGSLPSAAVIEFLTKAISDDKSDYVQLAALKVLSAMNLPKEQIMPLFQKAMHNEKVSSVVRRQAERDIKKYQGQ